MCAAGALGCASEDLTVFYNISSKALQPDAMAQAELEEKFKGIGLAEATAKCGFITLAHP